MEVFIRTNHDTVEDTSRAIIRTLFDTSRSWRTQQCPRAKPDAASFQNSVTVECSASYFTDVLSRLRVRITDEQRAQFTNATIDASSGLPRPPASVPSDFAFRVNECGMIEVVPASQLPRSSGVRTPRSSAQAFGLHHASYADVSFSPCGYAPMAETAENAALSLYDAATERVYQQLDVLNALASDRQPLSAGERLARLRVLCDYLSDVTDAARSYYEVIGKPFEDYPAPGVAPVFNGVATTVLTLRSVYSTLGFAGLGRAEQTHTLMDVNSGRVRISTLYDVYTPHMPVVLSVNRLMDFKELKALFPLTLRRADDYMTFVRI